MLVLFDVLFDLSREIHVCTMARAVGNDAGFYRVTHQGKITDHIE